MSGEQLLTGQFHQKSFSCRILDLPQELQDQILFYALAIEPETVTISTGYRFPWQLQVNRDSRKRVAEHYYATSAFVVPGVYSCVARATTWLRAMPKQHRAKLVDVRLLDSEPHHPAVKKTKGRAASDRARSFRSRLTSEHGVSIGSAVIKSIYFIPVLDDKTHGSIASRWASEEGYYEVLDDAVRPTCIRVKSVEQLRTEVREA